MSDRPQRKMARTDYLLREACRRRGLLAAPGTFGKPNHIRRRKADSTPRK